MKLATFSHVAMLIACSVTAAAQIPAINEVVSQASFTTPVSPGMPVLVNGTNLAGGNADCPGPVVPVTCGSVSVTINGAAMPVHYAYPHQVLTYIPVEQPPGPVIVVLKNHRGVNSAPFVVNVEDYAPGIQKWSDSSGSILGFFSNTSQQVITRANPASAGREIIAYTVGLGPTVPRVPTGQVGIAPVTTMPTLSLGNRAIPVLSAGLGCGTICDPGIYLVRFLLPADTPVGDYPVMISVAGNQSGPATLVVGPQPNGPAVGFIQSTLDSRVRRMAPGMVANVVGGGFMPAPGSGMPCSTDPTYWVKTCQGVRVTVNGIQAAIQMIMPNFITLQIPFEVSPGPASLVVEQTVDSQTVKSEPFSFTLEPVSPTLLANPQSPYPSIVIQNSGGLVSAMNPLLPGDAIYMAADGLGQTDPPMVTGFSLIQPARTVLTPSITVGGKPLEGVVSEVWPGSIGQYRITAIVPAGLGTGDKPIVLEIGGKKSQDGLLVPVSDQPVIAAVTNSASSGTDIAPGSWVSIYGRNLSPSRREWMEKDIIYDWLPTALDGVEVTINNAPAVVSFISPMQLNVLAPDNLPTGPVEVTVKSPLGWQKSTANVKPYAPGLFPLSIPPGVFLLALHADWSYVARPGQLPANADVRPARPGETIVFYGTGFGETNPHVSMYYRFSGSAGLSDSARVVAQIGSVDAKVSYVGLVANGLYQLNIVVPDVPDGDQEVVVSVGAEASPRGRFIPVKH